MKQLEITCPSCNETFSADQALQNHLKNKEQKYPFVHPRVRS